MSLCSRCGKNPAVVFITKLEGDKTTNEGLCLQCAKSMGIAPLNQMMDHLGIKDEDLENLNNEMSEFMNNIGDISSPEDMQNMLENLSGGEDDEGGAATAPIGFLSNMFSSGDKNGNKEEKTGTRKQARQSSKKKSMLDTYGTNLTAKAAMGKVDRVINRNDEIDRVIRILNRRTKNNPVILGEPGVGKTAIAEGLACRIFEKNVPPKLFGYQLYLIDFTALVAGTQFRGQFEARLKNLLNEATEAKNVILVIDEIHNIVAAGDAEGAMSAANILKPALAKGEIQIIGATTLSEYRKHIEKDSALERRFQPVLVDEPSVEESIEILKGIKDYYEDYHKVKISDEIIAEAVKLSERYITDRFLPDKAIDVIDEAGSRVNLKSKVLYDLKIYNDKLEEIDLESEEAAEQEDFEKSAELRSEAIRLKEVIRKANEEALKAEVTIDDIAAVIEGWTKIPVHRLTEDESQRLLELENRIHERVVGQNDAVDAVSRAIRRGRADISVKKRPVSFIFAGPTGVGKTELVKTIAEVLFGNEDALIRFDMSEYMEKHSVSKLIGSPPGYVGYDDAGQLTEKIRRKPYSVVLFDEIEKAHPDVLNILLQILDDGKVTDSHGKEVKFDNCVIVMTTNAGSSGGMNTAGFGMKSEQIAEAKTEKALAEFLRPEFINRVDEIITFRPLDKSDFEHIAAIMLGDTKKALSERGIDLMWTPAVEKYIAEKSFSEKYGARNMRRFISREIEDAAAEKIISEYDKHISLITIDSDGEKLDIETR